MKFAPQGVGRLDWMRYYAIRVSGTNAAFDARATFTFESTNIQVPTFCIEGKGSPTQLWIIAFPCMDARGQRLALYDLNENLLWQRTVTTLGLNLNNSITCRIKQQLTSQMQGIELLRKDAHAFIELLGLYPYDQSYEVARIRITFPQGVTPTPLNPAEILVNTSAASITVLDSAFDEDHCYQMLLSYRVDKRGGELLFAIPSTSEYGPGVLYVPPSLRSESVQNFARTTCDAAGDPRYASWFASHRVTQEEILQQRSTHFDREPLISIITPVFQPPISYLQECVESVLAQTYARWELVIVNSSVDDTEVCSYLSDVSARDRRVRVIELEKNLGIVGNTNMGIHSAQGQYVGFLDQDDLIEPDLLFEYVSRINQNPQAGLLYCDEDSFVSDLDGVFSPRFKPDFNPDLLYSHNYVLHLLMIRRDLLEQVGLSTPEVEGAQDHDLTLKVSEIAPVEHIVRVLYHWRQHERSTNSGNLQAKPYAEQAGIRAVQAHFDRCGVPARVDKGEAPYTYRVNYLLENEPLVSVIIPVESNSDSYGDCVTSLFDKAGWDNLEVLLVESGGGSPKARARYDKLIAHEKRVRFLHHDESFDFNHSKLVNYAARQACGTFLFLLSERTQVLSDNCIRNLVSYFQRGDVGLVGPLLLDPDGLVLTAGLALMKDGRLGFMNQHLTLATHSGYLGSLACPRDYSSVLGAAQMMPKALFDELGGYDEELTLAYGDVDFCWRARKAGKRVVYTPHAQLMHKAPVQTYYDNADPIRATLAQHEARLLRERWPHYFEQGDPELNPGCDPSSPWFKLPIS